MSSEPRLPSTLTVDEAAHEFFRTSRGAIWKLVQRGQAPCVVHLRRRTILFSRACLVRLLTESDVPPPARE
jgi:Helix-turn-helix domain